MSISKKDPLKRGQAFSEEKIESRVKAAGRLSEEIE